MAGDEAFERFAAHGDAQVVIVTTNAGDESGGCLVGFATQCSIDPVRYLVCLSKANRTYALACRAEALAVHVLHDTDDDRRLAHLFGEVTERDSVDKLARCGWRVGPWGLPVLDGRDWFAGEIVTTHDVGDHVAFVIAVGAGGTPHAADPPLGYQALRTLEPGNPA
jgi:flavin reductase (DIM6/NTAB) family NADH-FMN oxidoreductase RutF